MKSVLITGANRGIGKETARQLALRGWKVWLGSRSKSNGRDAADTLEGDIEVIELDVASSSSIKAAAEKIDALNVLINNAGVFEDTGESILAVTTDQILDTVKVNSFGPLELAQAFWPQLKASGQGRIINLSSGLGQLSEMVNETPAYAMSKTLLNAVTRQLAAAGRSAGIAVNSVCPGWVRTDMGGASALRSVEEGADTVVWLADEADQDLTGEFLRDRKPIPW